jgi:hypothetical protein
MQLVLQPEEFGLCFLCGHCCKLLFDMLLMQINRRPIARPTIANPMVIFATTIAYTLIRVASFHTTCLPSTFVVT